MEIREFMEFQYQLKSLEKNMVITRLSCHPNISTFFFNLGRMKEINGLRLYEDFTKYRFSIIMYNYRPAVYPQPMIKPVEDYKNHVNADNSLCLYHKNDFDWFNNQRLDKYIVPWIYTWQLYYNEWKRSGVWPGPEYPHQNK